MKEIKLQLRLWAAGKQDPADLDKILAPLAEAVACWEAVERLTAEDGSVTVCCTRPLYVREGAAAIVCAGEWLKGGHVLFYGDTRLAALRSAVAAMDNK